MCITRLDVKMSIVINHCQKTDNIVIINLASRVVGKSVQPLNAFLLNRYHAVESSNAFIGVNPFFYCNPAIPMNVVV